MSHDYLCPVAFMQRQNQDGGNCFCALIDTVRADEQAKQLTAIQRVRDLHKQTERTTPTGGVYDVCGWCTDLIQPPHGPWCVVDFPCATIRALDGERG